MITEEVIMNRVKKAVCRAVACLASVLCDLLSVGFISVKDAELGIDKIGVVKPEEFC